MSTLYKIACGLILLASMTTSGHAASAVSNSNVPPHTLRARPEKGNFNTLVLIDCRPDDRSRYDVLLDKEFPGAKLLYTNIDENVGEDVIGYLGFGSGAALEEYHHTELAIISGFERATTRIGKMTEEESAKIWDAAFAPGSKKKPIKLHLLTTNKKIPETYLRLVDSSRGTHRKLVLGSDGSYR